MPLIQIDEEMCRRFDQPCHSRWWFMSWYDIIGFELARGRSFDEVRRYLAESYADTPLIVEIANWLEANFSVRHWVEIGRR